MVDDGTPARSLPVQRGNLAKEDIRAGIEAVKDRVVSCYERGLEIDDALKGVVTLSFTIEGRDGKGMITKGEIANSDMHSLFFEACVLQEVAGAEFPAPSEGVIEVTYPFRFANVEAADEESGETQLKSAAHD